MKKIFMLSMKSLILLSLLQIISLSGYGQIIISQYHEGTGTNKWIELTNIGGTSINTASPQLKLGIWSVTGSTGNIAITGAPTRTFNLNVTIPAYGSVLIGNTGNGTEIPYLTAASAAQTNNTVINFNGNDGIALLNASNVILDQFGNGINATDIGYVRLTSVTSPSATYVPSQWSSATIASVQTAGTAVPARLGFQLSNLCSTPSAQASSLVFGTINATSIAGSFTSTATADEYLVLRTTSATLSANPVDATVYNAGNIIGNATVVSRSASTSFTASGLSGSTTYYFHIMSIKSVGCTGGPKYRTVTPLIGNATTTEPTLNYYFGNFHSHSEFSDGEGLPSGDFGFADAALCMDFLGISDHNHTLAGMNLANWAPGRSQAVASSTPTFLAQYGMEWGVSSTGNGHVIVYGMDSLIGWEAGQYQIFVAQTAYTGANGLFDRINRHGANCFATLAHPNNSDYNGIMSSYNLIANNAIVGTAVENGPHSSIDTTYSDYPSTMGYLSYYRNMLARGYHLGPTIDHDNHNITHGRTAASRTVVLSPSLSEADMLSSMRLMRFYASQDCAAFITFKINNNPLGSILTKPGAPVITVTTGTSSPVTSLKLYSGVPGSGSNATILTSTTNGTLNYTHAALTNGSTRYYYLDITEANGKRIITAPIWYTRNDAAPMLAVTSPAQETSVVGFFPIMEEGRIVAKWVSQQEIKGTKYQLEKSENNLNFEPVYSEEGRGYSPYPTYYGYEDLAIEKNKSTYYRLTQSDETGKILYSKTIEAAYENLMPSSITVYPNPFSNEFQLRIVNPYEEETQLELFTATGQRVLSKNVVLFSGEQTLAIETAGLANGLYILRLVAGGQTHYKKMMKE
jgi:hypothetical protein